MSRNIRFSLAPLTVLGLAPADVARVAAEAGYDAFGLRIHPVRDGERLLRLDGRSADREELAAVMRDTGIRMFDVEAFRLDQASDWGRMEAALAIGASLGAKSALTFIDERDRDRAIELYAHFCDLAEDYGLNASLEFMPWLGIGTLKGAADVAKAVNRHNARLVLDSLHVARSATSVVEIQNTDPRLIAYAQICDAPQTPPAGPEELLSEARFSRLIPGKGGLNLVEFVKALPSDIPISPEIPPTPNAEGNAFEHAKKALFATRDILSLARENLRS
ncbi:sugar phosphate isomerase/epimerase family protein [Paraburkholderia youngii]|uniref:sugar phosphate isomerase/epimerase family protein n=1 Tax=Paraburkholderia youngii TaxID=2782701 RepID=UPI003D1E34B8